MTNNQTHNITTQQWSLSGMRKLLSSILVLPALTLFIYQAQAQSNEQLLAKFKNDLDASMLRAYEGDRDAQFNVATLFASNQFQPADMEQAAYWYKQAARQGHHLAQYNLGHQYMEGHGVSKNQKLAMLWWLKAARGGHVLAQFNVGRGYYLGIGLQKNHEKSRYWFEQAAAQQEPKSMQILQQLGWADNISDMPVATHDKPVDNDHSTNDTSSKSIKPSEKSLTLTTTAPVTQDTATNDVPVRFKKTASKPLPIAVYTNPKINNVLITIVDDIASLSVVKLGDVWSSLVSNQGFPAWVHGDFIKVNGKQGSIMGSAVNARSVPIISRGTVIGRLDKGEKVTVMTRQKEWYRIIAPKRFKAWAKTDELTPQLKQQQMDNLATDQQQTDKPIKADNQTIDKAILAVELGVNTTVDNMANHLSTDTTSSENAWLFAQPLDNFTLQLASFDTDEAVKNFVSEDLFVDNPDLHQFVSENNKISWTYFLYGSYSNNSLAKKAQQKLGQKNAWIRSFRQLHQNRCITWKQQVPPPRELNKYCR